MKKKTGKTKTPKRKNGKKRKKRSDCPVPRPMLPMMIDEEEEWEEDDFEDEDWEEEES